MDFSLSEQQVMIRDSFRGSLERTCPLEKAREVAGGNETMDRDVWQAMCELGMAGLLIPEEFGGAGLGLLEAALVAEELGRSAAPIPFTGTAVMAPLALLLAGTDEQKAGWLPKLAVGDVRIGVGVAEAAAGRRDGTGVHATGGRLNGYTRAVIDAAECTAFLIADTEERLHLVLGHAEGLAIEVMPSIDGTRQAVHLRFDDVAAEPLPAGDGTELRKIIDAGRIIMAADSLGAGEEMLRQAVDYALQRKQFDRIIGSFQAVKHLCAEVAAELQPCRALIWYGAYAFDNLPNEVPAAAVHAKSQMDETGRFAARTTTEVHGGMGFTDLVGLHYWFKRIGQNRAFLGGPEALRAEQTERLLAQNA